jgi:hypothetical protein
MYVFLPVHLLFLTREIPMLKLVKQWGRTEFLHNPREGITEAWEEVQPQHTSTSPLR